MGRSKRLRRTTWVFTSSVGLCVRGTSRFGDVRVNVFMDVEGSNGLGDVLHEIAGNRARAVRHGQTFIRHSMTTLYRFLIGHVSRDGVPTPFDVLCVRAFNDLVRVSLRGVAIRPPIRRRTTFRVRFVSRFRRTSIKALCHFFRNNGHMHSVLWASCDRTRAIVESALICFRFIRGQAFRNRIRVFLLLCGARRLHVFFCGP